MNLIFDGVILFQIVRISNLMSYRRYCWERLIRIQLKSLDFQLLRIELYCIVLISCVSMRTINSNCISLQHILCTKNLYISTYPQLYPPTRPTTPNSHISIAIAIWHPLSLFSSIYGVLCIIFAGTSFSIETSNQNV